MWERQARVSRGKRMSWNTHSTPDSQDVTRVLRCKWKMFLPKSSSGAVSRFLRRLSSLSFFSPISAVPSRLCASPNSERRLTASSGTILRRTHSTRHYQTHTIDVRIDFADHPLDVFTCTRLKQITIIANIFLGRWLPFSLDSIAV